jgi:hypothetical protein
VSVASFRHHAAARSFPSSGSIDHRQTHSAGPSGYLVAMDRESPYDDEAQPEPTPEAVPPIDEAPSSTGVAIEDADEDEETPTQI